MVNHSELFKKFETLLQTAKQLMTRSNDHV